MGSNYGGFELEDSDVDTSFVDDLIKTPELDSYTWSPEGDSSSPSDDNFTESVLNYINQMLMDDDMEDTSFMSRDPLALQAKEQSLIEVLGEKDVSSSDVQLESPVFSSGFSDHGSSNSSSSSGTNQWSEQFSNGESGDFRPSLLQKPIPSDFVFRATAKPSSQNSSSYQNGFVGDGNVFSVYSGSEIRITDLFTRSDLMSQFKKGEEEASKFLPKLTPLVIDLPTDKSDHGSEKTGTNEVVEVKKDEGDLFSVDSRGKKNHMRDDDLYLEEERSNKQSASNLEEADHLSEMFDKLLIFHERGSTCVHDKTISDNSQNKAVDRNQLKQPAIEKDVDLRTLLIQCAQSVSTDDRKTAYELLKQIRQHSSYFGDGTQRVAHCFANGLEARLNGSGAQICSKMSYRKVSTSGVLKAYQVYMEACPFKKVGIIFANHTFLDLARTATTLHIIDFGILFGFQWPALIFRLSRRPGGPPKLRITGIEYPLPGLRPTEVVDQIGRRLAKYCERFEVPFEYNGIAKKWETVRIEDLKIRENEVTAVNCLFRFKDLLDETVSVDNPRDTVLKLIRNVKPDIFIQGVLNGSYGVPFFITRFREALFYFSAIFDMWDTNISREDEMRLMFEREIYGREIINVVACEGLERLERPETYKRWQLRNMRAGFKQLPVEPRLLKKLKHKVSSYHDDFIVDQDGDWLLQGWKGRILYASSAWVPV